MDVIETIRRRRSIRQFLDTEIPDDILTTLLEALRLAPSSGNRQPYKFVVVRDKSARAALASVCRYNPGRANGHEFMANAPLIIVACGHEKEAITRFYREGKCFLTTNVTYPPASWGASSCGSATVRTSLSAPASLPVFDTVCIS